ncbi:hypothetical protein RFI_20378 [Reticulomyxa filosa]|uniref:Uncharacterized protein n=1 Tax=Reticulomyxa filosa TaxID=46433 RepID=X6MV44_RETFI|nr:hypothetical protein RFI_20378 [Reticulomyxa filosa]|eukprot:ETO16960.1 hypothetical protein RFI_20378 [Reticulomyxa filosa]
MQKSGNQKNETYKTTDYIAVIYLFLGCLIAPTIIYYVRWYWRDRFDNFVKGRKPSLSLLCPHIKKKKNYVLTVVLPLRVCYTFLAEGEHGDVISILELITVIFVMAIGQLRFWHIAMSFKRKRYVANQMWSNFFAADATVPWYIKHYDFAGNIRFTAKVSGGVTLITCATCM